MAMKKGDRTPGALEAFMTQIERVPARLCFAVAGGLALGGGLATLAGRRGLGLCSGVSAAGFTAYALHNQRHGPGRTAAAAPDPAPRPESRERPFDYVDEMSADSFPASDPPAGPSSLGPPTWPAGAEPR